jgi:lipopolysaccharide/colanic/teichoic acid biosynthesis glycosyltransferase
MTELPRSPSTIAEDQVAAGSVVGGPRGSCSTGKAVLTNHHIGSRLRALRGAGFAPANSLPTNTLHSVFWGLAIPCSVGIDRAPGAGYLGVWLRRVSVWDGPLGTPLYAPAAGQPGSSRTVRVIRWMESLVERAGAAGAMPTIQRLWGAEPGPVELRPAEETARRHAGPVHRSLNPVLALTALVLLLPAFVLIALLVKLSSRGPVLYTQVRVGLDRRLPLDASQNHRRQRDLGGRPFTIYKFRTMRVDAEHHSGAVWAQQRDPRVTPIGRLLRQYRLDELPQLLNVLKGEMNIVGPRPERPTIFAELREHIAEYPLRQRAKPGITGLAQINHHYDRSLEDVRTKVHYDLEYIRRQSVSEDFRIMLKTLPVILLRRGGW